MNRTARHTPRYGIFVVQNLTSPKWGSSNPSCQLSHSVEVKSQHLRSPKVASAKINKLGHLFSSANTAYALVVQPHSGLILAGHYQLAHLPRIHAVFLCVSFAYARFMARQKRDTSECASFLIDLSANPLLSCRPHLAVKGKTSNQLGVTPMTNTAQNPSVETTYFTLHNPTDSTATSYTFDTIEAARAFKQQHCLSTYRISHVELFDAVENGGVFA